MRGKGKACTCATDTVVHNLCFECFSVSSGIVLTGCNGSYRCCNSLKLVQVSVGGANKDCIKFEKLFFVFLSVSMPHIDYFQQALLDTIDVSTPDNFYTGCIV